jgi:MinD-like ATPase involved in chromosome partitioning or flagellar assembly
LSAIVVGSGKGSPGATFVAVNLAAALARAKQDAVLIDLDPAGGDLCCYLGLDPRRGLYPLLRMEGSVSGGSRFLAEAEERSGFRVVGGFPEASELASPDVLAGALAAASAPERIVVADIGRVTAANAPIAAQAELVLLVVRADLMSVLGAERALRQLEAGGTDRERIRAVVSCHERRRPADLAEVGEALRLPILGTVHVDRRGARKALIAQLPVATRRLVRSFDALSRAARRALPDAAVEREAALELTEVSA